MASMSVAPLQHRGALERRAHRGGGRLVGVVNEAARLTSSIGEVGISQGLLKGGKRTRDRPRFGYPYALRVGFSRADGGTPSHTKAL